MSATQPRASAHCTLGAIGIIAGFGTARATMAPDEGGDDIRA